MQKKPRRMDNAMSKFTKKTSRPAAAIGTSALPDIVFMLLFFFMVVTVFRDHQLLLKVVIPHASQAKKLRHRSLVHHIYIGLPRDETRGNTAVVQINDSFVSLEKVKGAVELLVDQVPEAQQSLVTTSLRVDQEVEMGIVSDVKTALRKAKQYQVNYAAIPSNN